MTPPKAGNTLKELLAALGPFGDLTGDNRDQEVIRLRVHVQPDLTYTWYLTLPTIRWYVKEKSGWVLRPDWPGQMIFSAATDTEVLGAALQFLRDCPRIERYYA